MDDRWSSFFLFFLFFILIFYFFGIEEGCAVVRWGDDSL
jgi:hypothetical protein